MKHTYNRVKTRFIEKRNRAINRKIRRQLRRKRGNLFKELLKLQDENNGQLPAENHVIWTKFSAIHEMSVCDNWRMNSRVLNLSEPRTLAEKIEWLKLNDHREEFIQFSDKVAVRDYVLEKTGNLNLLNYTYGVYDRAEYIPVSELKVPFIIKANHWCGGHLICDSPESIRSESLSNLNKMLYGIFNLESYQWPYWHIKPKLLVEEYLEDQFAQLVDYKIFCFNGEPRFVMVCFDRNSDTKKLYFDTEWNLLPLLDRSHPAITQISDGRFPCPKSLNEMLHYAKLLSQDAEFIRVDFYDVFGQCRFGELTLYPGDGSGDVVQYEPDAWNYRLGDWLTLPKPNRNPRLAYATGFNQFEDVRRFTRFVEAGEFNS